MKKLLTILFLFCFIRVGICAVEDLTTFTEVDEDSDITVTSTKCDVDTMRNDANSSVYKDYGASHFGDFVHYVDIHPTSMDNYATFAFYSISNIAAATNQDMDDANSGFALKVWGNNGTYRLILQDFSIASDDYVNFVTIGGINKTYYCIIERSSNTLTAKIYSDASHTTLLDTLVRNSCDTTAFRYVSVTGSGDTPSYNPTHVTTHYVENLDLNEAAASRRRLTIQ